MANMKTFEELKDLLCHELDALTKKGEVTRESLDHFYKLLSAIKNIDTVTAMHESGYSNDGYSQRIMPRYSYNSYDGGMSNRGSYDDGMSNRGSYNSYGSYDGRAGRDADSDGRYSEDYSRNSYNRGSYDGYSRHTEKERMVEKLESMMREASSEKERMAIKRCIEQMNN